MISVQSGGFSGSLSTVVYLLSLISSAVHVYDCFIAFTFNMVNYCLYISYCIMILQNL